MTDKQQLIEIREKHQKLYNWCKTQKGKRKHYDILMKNEELLERLSDK